MSLPVVAQLKESSERMARRLRPLEGLAPELLQLHEIYASVQGEGSRAGLPCTFVRLTACHLRCSWCDTRKAFGGGERTTQAEALKQVAELGHKLVLITGGEPLLQAACYPLMTALCDAGCEVLLETSGGLSIADVDPRVVRIVDIKAPSSGEVDSNVWENLALLTPRDEVKFVLADEADYLWARDVMREHNLTARCPILMGTAFGLLEPRELVAWVMRDKLDVRVQLQLHKYIWDPKMEGV